MQAYLKQKREKIDYCNICGELSNLTWDHVPPKSCYNNMCAKYTELFLCDNNKYSGQFQSGIRYRSICSNCNNKLLGSMYDVELDKLVQSVKNILSSSLNLPSLLKLSDVKINKVARSICGHILAAKNYYDKSSLIDKSLRAYFLNSNTKPPQDLKLLYWIYPYNTILVSRDVSVKSYDKSVSFPEGVISVLSAFPIAYILTTGTETCGLHDLFSCCSENVEEVINFPIDFHSCYYPYTNIYRDLAWPCNVSDEHDGAAFMLANDRNTCILATRKTNAFF